MGGYAAATAAPIVNPYALMLMCPGAGMWFGCKDRAEAMEAQGITKADIEGLTFPTSFNHDLFNYEPFSSAAVSYTHLEKYGGGIKLSSSENTGGARVEIFFLSSQETS